MIKAVFLSEIRYREYINKVFAPSSMDIIREYAEVYGEFIDKRNLEENALFLKDTEVIFSTWGMPKLTEGEIKQYFPVLKAVFYGAGSVQDFARSFLNLGIKVVSAWAANAVPVAEYTVAQILLANKGFFQNSILTKRDRHAASQYSNTFPGNYSAKIGIIGAGMIGTKVIELLKPFNLELMVYDPFLSDEKAEKLGVIKCSLSEIFTSCQTISNHTANLPSTLGMLKKEHFDVMLPNATFINTGRGAQVVEKDLVAALKEVPERTALLDVTEPEPVEPDSEFLKMENVFLTSHIAGSMCRELERMGLYAAEEFERYIKGESLKYSVTLKMLETMA